jgi:phosphoribosylanthranilate isomerase
MTEDRNHTRIKICGITNAQDALGAAEAGADLLGFVFYPKSPRFVAPDQAAAITQSLRRALGERTPRFVGVFVDEAIPDVRSTLDRAGLDLAQLHGHESPSDLGALAPRAFKAIRPRTGAEAAASLAAYRPAMPADGAMPQLLVDAFHPQHFGGTGLAGDWTLAGRVARDVRLLLAGGLTPGTVGRAIAQVRPWGVDVSSGVEQSKGAKDPARLRAFVHAVRAADAARQ